jgi:iron complex transport system permease protein
MQHVTQATPEAGNRLRRQQQRLGRIILLGACAAALAALATALSIGSVDIPPRAVIAHLFGDDGSVNDRIIDTLRGPRALTAFAVGALLALAGALMQVLLRNPLGDPYILGLSGGASSAVLAAMLLGLSASWYPPAALGGALLSTLIVFGLGARTTGQGSDRLLLTGVVVAAGWAALISFVLSISPAAQLPGMLFWLMGDLSDADRPGIPVIVLLVGLLYALWRARDLNLAAHGPLQAAALGVNPLRLRNELFFVAAALTAAAVTSAGSIGFIGLVTPHLVRLAGGRDHRILLPASALAGGALLVLADAVARTLIAPMQLPVGVLTALLGVPVFLLLLHRGSRP